MSTPTPPPCQKNLKSDNHPPTLVRKNYSPPLGG